jgi:hypothetical protein
MGKYLKTRYPGVFQYVGKNGTVYGIDYYSGGKKHREIVGPLLGDARTKLEEMRQLSKRGLAVPASSKKKITFKELREKYEGLLEGSGPYESSKKYLIKPLSDYFDNMRLFQIIPLIIEGFKKNRKEGFTKAGESKLRTFEEKAKAENREVTSGEREACKRSEISVNRELEVLRHMLNKAVEWSMIHENPFERFKESIFFK